MVCEIYVQYPSSSWVALKSGVAELGLDNNDQLKWNISSNFEELRAPEYAEKNPFRKTPWFRDTETDLELYECRTILRYLGEKFNSPLCPKPGTAEYWRLDALYMAEATTVHPWTYALNYGTFYDPKFFGGKLDDTIIKTGEAKLEYNIRGYEEILKKQRYLAGNKLTLVDVFCQIELLIPHREGYTKFLTDGSLPNVKRWFEEIIARPAFEQAARQCLIDFSKLTPNVDLKKYGMEA